MYGKHLKRRGNIKVASIKRHSMGYLGNREWQEILDNLRQSKNELHSIPKGSGGLSKNNDQQGTPKDRGVYKRKLNQDFCIICGRDVSDTENQVCVRCRSQFNSMTPNEEMNFYTQISGQLYKIAFLLSNLGGQYER